VAAILEVPGQHDRLGLSGSTPGARDVRAVVVLLVDGLGWELLRAHADVAPFLGTLGLASAPVETGFPSTTATSMASFGTGAVPGRHGLVGYSFALGDGEPVMNALRWDSSADPLDVQPLPTVFERAADHGVAVTHVALRHFEGSGLTRAALRGARYAGADTMGEVVQATAEACRIPGRALVYAYTGDLDNVGHVRGCGSPGWRTQLEHVDLLARQLVDVLPPDAMLLVTADHGMVDVGPGDRVDFDTEPVLSAGVRALGGEPRARHVYARPGAADDVLAAWRHRLGPGTVVLSRQEAVAAGWFGEVSPAVLCRIGDVVTAPSEPTAVVASRAKPREAALVGYHGSSTSAERLVPMLVVHP
jgi:hypothetical protein